MTGELRGKEEEMKKNAEYSVYMEREVNSCMQKVARLGEVGMLGEGEEGVGERERLFGEESDKAGRLERERRAENGVMQKVIVERRERFLMELEQFERAQGTLEGRFGSLQTDLGQACEMISADGNQSLDNFRNILKI